MCKVTYLCQNIPGPGKTSDYTKFINSSLLQINSCQ